MKFDYKSNKGEVEFWDDCERNKLDKRAFIQAVRKTFKDPVHLRSNFVVETAERLLYAFSVEANQFYLLGSVKNEVQKL